MEAEPTKEGKKMLEKMRKQHKEKFKFCRPFLTKQLVPSHHTYLEPFRLTTKGQPYEGIHNV